MSSSDPDARDDAVEVLATGPGGPCSGLLESLRAPDGAWLHPVVEANDDGLSGEGVRAAVIDTGLSLEHTRLRSAVVERVDLTGEGEGDACGHGTVVALILLAAAPATRLIDVKALGADGRTTADRLIQALDWVAGREDVDLVNLSAGVYRTYCTGGCELCLAASRVAGRVPLFAAAGNRPGLTACPAKAAGVFPIAEVDPLMTMLTATSSPAGREGFAQVAGSYRMERSEPA